MDLRYGVNPGQAAYVASATDGQLPFRVLAGEPSYINLLDALNSWQLVRSLSDVLDQPAAASFKHVSPAGAAVAGPIDEVMAATWNVAGNISSVASAYVRARDADPKSSWGDFVSVSEPVDADLVEVLRRTANDGIIAPGYEPGTVEVLRGKKGGRMLVLKIDPDFDPPAWEQRDVFGVSLFQQRPDLNLDNLPPSLRALPLEARRDALLGMLTVAYTQSNSIGLVRSGMIVGVGAGQQSRVDCVRLAGGKADVWWLRRHPGIRGIRFLDGPSRQDRISAVVRILEGDLAEPERHRLDALLTGPIPKLDAQARHAWLAGLSPVTLVSDGLIPFRDNVDHAARHAVSYFVEPGGSVRSGEVTEACEEYGIVHVQTGIRLFHH